MTTRREANATAVVGLAGVGGAAAMRHHALEAAYEGKKRPPLAQELKMLRRGTKGRGLYAAGMLTGAVATPAAVSGIDARLSLARSHVAKHRSFIQDGAAGVKDSLKASNTTLHNPPPAKLALANYLGGGAVTAGTGALVNRGLKGAKMGGGKKAALAAVSAVTAGAATLPLQSKLMSRVSGGSYETTAHGVRRKKTRAVRPSTKASMVDAHGVPTPVGKLLSPRKNKPRHLIESHDAAMWDAQNRGQPAVAQAHQQFIRELKALKTGARNRGLAAAGVGATTALAGGSLLSHKKPVVKDYYGQDMTHAQKRARVAAVTGLPVVADIAQAAQAGRMAPPELRKKTTAETYLAGQAGGAAGSVGGAYGAVALARRSKKFEAGSEKLDDALSAGKAKVREAAHLKEKAAKPGLAERLAEGAQTPGLIKRAVKPLVGHGKVAAVGAVVGGALGGVVGSQSGYGAALAQEDRYKAKVAKSNQSARHGSRVDRHPAPPATSKRAAEKLRRSKESSATMSQVGGAIGLTALGASVGSKVKALGAKTTGHLGKIPMPLLTAGAGLSGVNAFKYADIQHKEAAAAKVGKALLPVPSINRRVPAAVKGSLRQTRTASTGAIRTTYARGGIR